MVGRNPMAKPRRISTALARSKPTPGAPPTISKSRIPRPSLVTAMVLLAVASLAAADEAPPFSEVRAIFAAKCLSCHGNDPKELKGDYDLRSHAAAIKGGESGEPAIIPGQPEKSPLYRAITWEDDALQ